MNPLCKTLSNALDISNNVEEDYSFASTLSFKFSATRRYRICVEALPLKSNCSVKQALLLYRISSISQFYPITKL